MKPNQFTQREKCVWQTFADWIDSICIGRPNCEPSQKPMIIYDQIIGNNAY